MKIGELIKNVYFGASKASTDVIRYHDMNDSRSAKLFSTPSNQFGWNEGYEHQQIQIHTSSN